MLGLNAVISSPRATGQNVLSKTLAMNAEGMPSNVSVSVVIDNVASFSEGQGKCQQQKLVQQV